MSRAKYIIIPTDFSSTADNALEYAIQINGLDNWTYLILNAYHAPQAGSNAMFVNINDMLAKESKRELKVQKEKILDLYPGISVQTKSVHGTVEEVINNLELPGDIDSVVMGTTGAGGLKKALIGSNAQKVIYESRYPVYTVPRGYDFKSPSSIVYAADLETIPSPELFDRVVQIAKRYNTEVKVLHVDHSKDSAENIEREKNRLKLADRLADVKHSFHVMKRYEVAAGIDDFVFDSKTDLLVLVPRKMTFLRSLFRTAITQKIVCHTKIPLLAIKAK